MNSGADPVSGFDPFEGMVLAIVFLSVVVFTSLGVVLFSRGWDSYEERYLEDAGRSMEAMFLTIPPQVLIYLSSLLFFLVTVGLSMAMGGAMLLPGLLGLCAAGMPRTMLKRLKKNRETKFRQQLLPALQGLSNNLKAGFSLPKSWEQIANESINPMKQEVRILLQEIRLGSSMEEAVDSLYERLPSEDLALVATAVHIAGKVGGNLPAIFSNLENIIRERSRIEGKIGSMTGQGRFQAIVVALLPALLVVALSYINPEFMKPLFSTTAGWVIITFVFLLDFIGYWMIQKIVGIDI